MAKSKFSFSVLLLLIPNIVAVMLLLMAYLANYFNPKAHFWVALCGCLYPYILILNALFVVLWVFRWNRWFLLSLICILIGLSSLKRLYQFKGKKLPENVENTVKMMSYNVQVMGLYSNLGANIWKISYNQRDSIVDLIKNEKPAILCLQEYYADNNPKTTFPTTSLIKKSMDEPQSCFYMPFKRGSHQYGLAIFSTYPIVKQGNIDFKSLSNLAMYADLKIGTDTIRVFNAHFQSLHLQKEDYIFAENYSELSNDAIAQNSKRILKKMKKGFAIRAEQVKILSDSIKASPYKAIVCGDFNDTPWSFTYKQIQNLLKDTYAESGKSFGNTMKINKFLSFRIDYIFCDKNFNSYQFTALPYAASDHLPVCVHLDIQGNTK